MFYLIAAASIAWVLVTASIAGRRAAIASAWMLVLILPSWMHRTLGAADLDLRFVMVMASILLLLARTSVGAWPKIVLADLVVVALVMSVVVSRLLIRGPSPSWILHTLVGWLLPYVFGRILFSTAKDYRSLVKFAVLALCFLFAYALFEVTFGVNPLHSMSKWSRWHSESYRFGLKRVEGPLTHPIYFGLAMLLLLPWSIYAWTLSRREEAPKWWQLMPFMNVACIILSGSRGAMIGTAIAMLTIFIVRRTNRLIPGLAALVLCVGAVVYWGQLVEGLRYFAGEPQARESLSINGQEHAYSGTLHRIVQITVYNKALQECGMFGFANVCSGEDNARYLRHVEYHLRDLFFSIDNHYLFFTLDCGYVGIGLFVLLGTVVLAYLLRPSANLEDPNSFLAASLAGSILGTMIMLWTVWLPPAFRFYFLCNCGMAASWHAAIAAAREPAMRSIGGYPTRIPIVHRRLVPGHSSTAMEPQT